MWVDYLPVLVNFYSTLIIPEPSDDTVGQNCLHLGESVFPQTDSHFQALKWFCGKIYLFCTKIAVVLKLTFLLLQKHCSGNKTVNVVVNVKK